MTGPCWLWGGTRYPNGYPMAHRGYGRKGRTTLGAHRLVYTTLVGPIPEGLELDHLCEVKSCVNPAHLEPVTPKENTRRGAKNRHIVHKTVCRFGHAPHPPLKPCRECNRIAVDKYQAKKRLGGT